jgi:hypothetical protein
MFHIAGIVKRVMNPLVRESPVIVMIIRILILV